ncbi:hypothetical protein JAAARDRAFT_123325, partial [Jaapia argillacea MUCL 33604]
QKIASMRNELAELNKKFETENALKTSYEEQLTQKEEDIVKFQHEFDSLEDELEKKQAALAEASEKYVPPPHGSLWDLDVVGDHDCDLLCGLRQIDVKAEYGVRQVSRLTKERDTWEKKYKDAEEKYQASKAELDELVSGMEGL